MLDSGDFEKPVVVIDNGSYLIKAGFSSDNHPLTMFRNVVGRPSYLKGYLGKQFYDVLIGDNAVEKEHEYDLFRPVQKGRIVNWDNMERVWHHIFYNELKVAPEDRQVLLGVSSTAPMSEKIKCCEIFFESLNSPGLSVQHNSALALYGSGFTSGVTVDLGYDSTSIDPLYEGGQLNYAHTEAEVCGAKIANFLKNKLWQRGYFLGSKTEKVVEDIKNNLCYVIPKRLSRGDLNLEHKSYTLPSGDIIDVTNEATEATETMFKQPARPMSYSTFDQGRWSEVSLASFNMGDEPMPLQEAILSSILRCDSDLHDTFYDSIVTCGGLATLPGLNERMKNEIYSSISRNVTIAQSSEAYCVSWLGGAVFSGIQNISNVWVTRKQYDEQGAKIIKNRFIT